MMVPPPHDLESPLGEATVSLLGSVSVNAMPVNEITLAAVIGNRETGDWSFRLRAKTDTPKTLLMVGGATTVSVPLTKLNVG